MSEQLESEIRHVYVQRLDHGGNAPRIGGDADHALESEIRHLYAERLDRALGVDGKGLETEILDRFRAGGTRDGKGQEAFDAAVDLCQRRTGLSPQRAQAKVETIVADAKVTPRAGAGTICADGPGR